MGGKRPALSSVDSIECPVVSREPKYDLSSYPSWICIPNEEPTCFWNWSKGLISDHYLESSLSTSGKIARLNQKEKQSGFECQLCYFLGLGLEQAV